MKRIVIDAREYPTSTGRYIRKLLEYLEKIDGNNDRREYVILIKSADFDSYQPKAKNFTKVRADFKEFTFSEQIGFLRLIRKLKADLIHFGMVQQPIFYRGKTVTTMHDLTTLRFTNPDKNIVVFKLKQAVYALVNKRVAHTTNRIITASSYVKDDIIAYAHVDPSKIAVTYESADTIAAPRETFPQLKNKPYLLYVGRTLPHKNIERLIEAFEKIKVHTPNLSLVLVGKKDNLTQRHLDFAKKKGIKNVVATGYVSEGQLRWLYENCACYCFPSLSEGFGLPSLEAMMHGAPVASSNATCLPEVNGDAAHYFDPLDVADMAEKITDVLTDEKLRSGLAKKGSQQVKKYSWERMARQTLTVYREVLDG